MVAPSLSPSASENVYTAFSVWPISAVPVAGEALHADLALVDLLKAGQLRQDGIDERVIAVCIVNKQLTVIACALQDHQIVVEAGDLAFLIVICLDPRIGARLAAARRRCR